jgi:hypothetical protein
MNAPASKPRSKNPSAGTKPTNSSSLGIQQSLGSSVVNTSSLSVPGVESLSYCGKNFKTENAMQQHKRDSQAHPESLAYHLRPAHTRYGYDSQPDMDSSWHDDEDLDYSLCDKDCGRCGHCADYLDI